MHLGDDRRVAVVVPPVIGCYRMVVMLLRGRAVARHGEDVPDFRHAALHLASGLLEEGT